MMMSRVRRFLRRSLFGPVHDEAAIRHYLHAGRKPWSNGYEQYKTRFITQALADQELMEAFRAGLPLPAKYGPRLDERVVEFPWALSQLQECGPHLLDAGSTFNKPHLLEHPVIKDRTLVIYTLAPESWTLTTAKVSYIYGDLRKTILRDGCMDAVVCISTLEHIGMDNTMLYTKDKTYQECDLTAYRSAVAELSRVLKPGGVALISVPFGKRENHGWQQQFDRDGVEDIMRNFDGELQDMRLYRYWPSGWALSAVEECADCVYFNIHATPKFDSDYAAAARAVACLRLMKRNM